MNTDFLIQFSAFLLSERCVARNTHSAYIRDVGQMITYLENKNVSLSAMPPGSIAQFFRSLYEKGLSARSLGRKIAAIRLFAKYVSERCDIPLLRDLDSLCMPKIEKRLARVLNEQEIQQMLSYAQKSVSARGKRNSMMLYLLYASGLRVSELTSLHLDHLELQQGMVYVTGKRGKQRVVPLPALVVDMLGEYISVTRPLLVGACASAVLFPCSVAQPHSYLSRNTVWKLINNIARAVGISSAVSPHQFRHSYATHLLKAGAHVRSLQLLLGHENINTVQHYTHLDVSHLRSIYDAKHPRA